MGSGAAAERTTLPRRPEEMTAEGLGRLARQVDMLQGAMRRLASGEASRPGQKVGVSLLPDGRVELRAAETTASIARLRGALRRPRHRPISLAEMQDAIERGAGPG